MRTQCVSCRDMWRAWAAGKPLSGTSHSSLLCGGPSHPTQGLWANSPTYSAEPLLSCQFFPHTPITSFRQHGPCRVWCIVTTSCLWSPRGALGGRGLQSALTTERPTIPGAPSSWEDGFKCVDQRTASHSSNFQMFFETHSKCVIAQYMCACATCAYAFYESTESRLSELTMLCDTLTIFLFHF